MKEVKEDLKFHFDIKPEMNISKIDLSSNRIMLSNVPAELFIKKRKNSKKLIDKSVFELIPENGPVVGELSYKITEKGHLLKCIEDFNKKKHFFYYNDRLGDFSTDLTDEIDYLKMKDLTQKEFFDKCFKRIKYMYILNDLENPFYDLVNDDRLFPIDLHAIVERFGFESERDLFNYVKMLEENTYVPKKAYYDSMIATFNKLLYDAEEIASGNELRASIQKYCKKTNVREHSFVDKDFRRELRQKFDEQKPKVVTKDINMVTNKFNLLFIGNVR